MVTGSVEIIIIQGDTCQRNISVSGIQAGNIQAVYVSCGTLNICKNLPYDSETGKYNFILTPEETALLTPITTNYDITIEFTDQNVKTASYRGPLIVLPKNNKVRCVEND